MKFTSRSWRAAGAALGLAAGAAGMAGAADAGFELADTPGIHMDVRLDGRTVARYQYAHDVSTKERRAETYKPFLHVFDKDGKAPITKGAGGNYTHHRGIFIGWSKIGFNGKTYDRWHMNNGEIVHLEFTERKSDADGARLVSRTAWNDEAGKPMIEEERAMSFRRAPAPARLIVDFTSRLKAVGGEVNLGGDPEHAGIHFRPANEIDAKQTVYVFPAEKPNAHKDVDYPWVGESFTVGGARHSVVQMNHPGNPKGTRFSAYRNYGRFGAFFTKALAKDETLEVKYRFLIADGEMPPAAAIQKSWDDFAGAAAPSPVPTVTAVPAEQPAPPKPKAK